MTGAGRFVGMRCWVPVEACDLARTRHACDVAWRRWTGGRGGRLRVGLDPEDEPPTRWGPPTSTMVLASDARDDEDVEASSSPCSSTYPLGGAPG